MEGGRGSACAPTQVRRFGGNWSLAETQRRREVGGRGMGGGRGSARRPLDLCRIQMPCSEGLEFWGWGGGMEVRRDRLVVASISAESRCGASVATNFTQGRKDAKGLGGRGMEAGRGSACAPTRCRASVAIGLSQRRRGAERWGAAGWKVAGARLVAHSISAVSRCRARRGSSSGAGAAGWRFAGIGSSWRLSLPNRGVGLRWQLISRKAAKGLGGRGMEGGLVVAHSGHERHPLERAARSISAPLRLCVSARAKLLPARMGGP